MDKVENTMLQQAGIVAGICNEIGLIETIDHYIPKPKRKVSVGQAVQAMVLNGLGFTGRALYLTPRFFSKRPVEILIGENVTAADLHDDCLGTALDALYEYGITELFYHTAAQALHTYGIEYRFVHLDSTTFSLHGAYDGEEDDTQVVKITKGFSKDHKPELNQVIATLMCAYRSSVPVWLEVLSGNESDKTTFRKSIRQYCAQFDRKQLPYFVADSALYTRESLQELSGVRWVSRVPETVKEVKDVIRGLEKDKMNRCADPHYRITRHRSEYGGVSQRWVIVYSEKSYQREKKTFAKNLLKKTTELEKEWWHLSNQDFACEADAIKAAEKFRKKLKLHTVAYQTNCRLSYPTKGRPGKNTEPNAERWNITGTIAVDQKAIAEAEKTKGMFIVATNELDEKRLSDESLLNVYKAQGVSVERGFRFLKDPLFYAESMYLNSPKRIMALIMVMGLSLLVYSLAEKRVRAALQEGALSIPNQVGKPTNNPTIRWVFQIFESILLLHFQETGEYSVMNLEEENITILTALGPPFKKIYFLD